MSIAPARSQLEALRSLLARETGLRFEDDKLQVLSELLANRMLETSSPSADAYLARLETSPEEISSLARTLTVSETYFLRNRDQFRAFEALLRARAAGSTRHVRILSAGCSSGEEPYSLAIAILETLTGLDGWTISVLGVDLNPEVLDKARAASYTAWSLRETPEDLRQRYFRKSGEHYVLEEQVRTMVRFQQRNLMRPGEGLWRNEAFDVVFCRNVLMYFTPAAAAGVVANVARSLSPGGHLFLGHAENLRGLSHDFHLRHSHETFYYQRRASLGANDATVVDESPTCAPASNAAVTSGWFEAIGRATDRIESLSRGTEQPSHESGEKDEQRTTQGVEIRRELSPALDLMKEERFQEALRLLATAPSTADAEPDVLLLRAMLLVSTGELANADAACSALLRIDELNAGAHYIMAMCREHAGDRRGAVEHSQTAAYLDPGFAMPHLQLGRLARRAGDFATAHRELGLAIGLLAREDAAHIVLFGGGFGREALIQLCRAELVASDESAGGGNR